jgi:hypothetical protein
MLQLLQQDLQRTLRLMRGHATSRTVAFPQAECLRPWTEPTRIAPGRSGRTDQGSPASESALHRRAVGISHSWWHVKVTAHCFSHLLTGSTASSGAEEVNGGPAARPAPRLATAARCCSGAISAVETHATRPAVWHSAVPAVSSPRHQLRAGPAPAGAAGTAVAAGAPSLRAGAQVRVRGGAWRSGGTGRAGAGRGSTGRAGAGRGSTGRTGAGRGSTDRVRL